MWGLQRGISEIYIPTQRFTVNKLAGKFSVYFSTSRWDTRSQLFPLYKLSYKIHKTYTHARCRYLYNCVEKGHFFLSFFRKVVGPRAFGKTRKKNRDFTLRIVKHASSIPIALGRRTLRKARARDVCTRTSEKSPVAHSNAYIPTTRSLKSLKSRLSPSKMIDNVCMGVCLCVCVHIRVLSARAPTLCVLPFVKLAVNSRARHRQRDVPLSPFRHLPPLYEAFIQMLSASARARTRDFVADAKKQFTGFPGGKESFIAIWTLCVLRSDDIERMGLE